MFNFFDMAFNYEDRAVERHEEKGKYTLDTCRVTDCQLPFETAVSHLKFNKGNWIILEHYATKELAVAGHHKWLAIIQEDTMEELWDYPADDFVDALGSTVFVRDK